MLIKRLLRGCRRQQHCVQAERRFANNSVVQDPSLFGNISCFVQRRPFILTVMNPPIL
jgi:hypothetical protein